jgi:hypothetical protein
MTFDQMQSTGLPPEVAEHLDQLLANWRQQRQLDAPTAAAIRQAILTQREPLPVQWWQEHREQIDALVAQSRRLAYELARAGLAQAYAQRVRQWRANQPMLAAWSEGYVRLG